MPESNTQTSNRQPHFNGPIEVNHQVDFPIDDSSIQLVVSTILTDAGFQRGSISIAIVDDPTIHRLNLQYLQHDYPTDVLSFLLESDPQQGWLEGEVIVSSDTATSNATEYQWEPTNELMLYIIHGCLHLTGMDDATDELRAVMQAKETLYLGRIGLVRPGEDPLATDSTAHSSEDRRNS